MNLSRKKSSSVTAQASAHLTTMVLRLVRDRPEQKSLRILQIAPLSRSINPQERRDEHVVSVIGTDKNRRVPQRLRAQRRPGALGLARLETDVPAAGSGSTEVTQLKNTTAPDPRDAYSKGTPTAAGLSDRWCN